MKKKEIQTTGRYNSIMETILGTRCRSNLDYVSVIRKGVKKEILISVSKKTSLTIKELADVLPVTERTIQRYDINECFKPNVSEKIIEIDNLYTKGFEVFEDEENFISWMNSPNIALGGMKPKELLDTTVGINMVMDEIGRIEHGVLA